MDYLLNEESDKALDLFTKLVQVEPDTLEFHLSLGKLFRKKGEIDKAIKIHQNIISHSNISKNTRTHALFELAEDYLVSGMLDRAEHLFQEVLKTESPYKIKALYGLLLIYEREKEWKNALTIAHYLDQFPQENLGKVIAQYYCEMIEDKNAPLDQDTSAEYLSLALVANENSVRVSLLCAEIELLNNRFKEALKIYKRLLLQSLTHLPFYIAKVEKCYKLYSSSEEWVMLLEESLNKQYHPLLVLTLTKEIKILRGALEAKIFLETQLKKRVFLAGIEALIDLNSNIDRYENKDQIGGFLRKLISEDDKYHCEICGFNSKKLLWLCPSCRTWESIKASKWEIN